MKLPATRIAFEKTLQRRNSFTNLCICPLCEQSFIACLHTESEVREFLECELFEAQKSFLKMKEAKNENCFLEICANYSR